MQGSNYGVFECKTKLEQNCAVKSKLIFHFRVTCVIRECTVFHKCLPKKVLEVLYQRALIIHSAFPTFSFTYREYQYWAIEIVTSLYMITIIIVDDPSECMIISTISSTLLCQQVIYFCAFLTRFP